MVGFCRLLILLCVVLFAATPAAQAAILQGGSTIDRDQILLGDLFNGAGDKAAVAISPAPAPGRKAAYDMTSLLRIARTYGVDWTPQSQFDRVEITRASIVIDQTTIKSALLAALIQSGAGTDLQVEPDNRSLELNLPTGIDPKIRVENLTYSSADNRFSALLVVANEQPVAVTGRAFPIQRIPVLTKALRAGQIIGESDIDWQALPANKTGADTVMSLDDLLGKEVKRPIAAGIPIRNSSIQSQRLVKRGGLVTLSIETPALQMTAQGIALTDAAMDEQVRVRNTQSNRVIEGVVIGPDLVRVGPDRMRTK
jgi:flagellar basal body P-ring formation protein FlgA